MKVTPLFARQPIFDRNLKVVAYELLFRGGLDSFANHLDGDQATSHVLLYAFGQHRIEDITGNLPAYINYTRHWLVFPPPLPPRQLVIEILEDVKPDKQVCDALRELKRKGYQIALDDFFINRDTQQLLCFANTIKIDVLALDESKIEHYVRYLTPHGVKLLAEKIETYEMFEYCKSLGFDYFQGYFLSKPHTIQGLKISESKNAVLRLLSILTSPTAEIKQVVDTIALDPALSYRILKIVNSTSNRLCREVSSINQAVTLLGINQVRNWASFLILNSSEEKPRELWCMSLTRARFCERVGAHVANRDMADTCFTAGILSMFDAFLDIPMRVLVASLSLAPEITLALTERKGTIGYALDLVTAVERAEWDALGRCPLLRSGALDDATVQHFYADALSWAQEIVSEYHD